MARSMTGFGSARATDGQRAFVVEVRAVNHKFCDVRTRVPRELTALEGPIQGRVRNKVARGRIDVSVDVTYLPEAVAEPTVNVALARGYHAAYAEVATTLGVDADITLGMVIAAPGVIESPSASSDLVAISAVLHGALDDALESLNSMRDKEGSVLAGDLDKHLRDVELRLHDIQEEIPRANALRSSRLEQRVRDLMKDHSMDQGRIAQEIAILVDRADVSEEVTRLQSHCVQFRKLLRADKPIGRKLDFLLQEMNREANTIGSKSANAGISHLVVDLKSAVERIREQVQNVE